MTITFKGGIIAAGEIKAEVNITPVWATIAGTLGTFDELIDPNFQFDATDPEGGALVYTVISGSLPTGLSLSSAGLLSGTPADVESNITSGFTLRVTDEGGLFQERTFSMEIRHVPPPGPRLFTWGWSSGGRSGLGDNSSRSSPTQIGSDVNWQEISVGDRHTLAIKTDGTLWAWGTNGTGRLGLGDTINRSSPVQIGSLTIWTKIAASAEHSLALKSDGTMWSFGNNDDDGDLTRGGQLGDGTNINRSSPVQVLGGSSWAGIAVGFGTSFSVKTDGTLWSWGRTQFGALGHGISHDYKSSPVQIGALNTWSSVHAEGRATSIFAIKTDNTMFSWGKNNNGQLGINNINSKYSPVQVDGGAVWNTVSTGAYSSMAVRTNGTLWGWGRNTNGQIGDGTTSQRHTPVQIGNLATWQIVNAGNIGATAIKSDGTLWTWGNGFGGANGQGNSANYSSPIQVGDAIDWVKVSRGDRFTIGIRDYV